MDLDKTCFGCFSEKSGDGPCPVCGFDEAAYDHPYVALPTGTILNGRYVTGKVLGVGGFGITYLGFDLTLEIRVAIKEFMPQGVATRTTDGYTMTVMSRREEENFKAGAERFLSEARTIAKLNRSENIVYVQNYFSENNTAYFVMDYVDGESLRSYVDKKGGRISFGEAISLLRPVMTALCDVHAQNLIHRDISPDNIFITKDGKSKLLDFGAARQAGGNSMSVILKRGYAPEEQYSTRGNQGAWTDVYAMAATIYDCITGELPPDSIERVTEDTLVPASEKGADVSPAEDAALMKALSLHAQDRFQSMGEFLSAIGAPATTAAYSVNIQDSPKQEGGFFKKLFGSPARIAIASGILVAVILAIVLPIALTSGHGSTPAGGSVTTPFPAPSTAATAAPATAVPATAAPVTAVPATSAPATAAPATGTGAATGTKYTSDTLGFSINVSTGFTATENNSSVNFKSADGTYVLNVSYSWLTGTHLYSVTDVMNNKELFLSAVVQNLGYAADDYTLASDYATGSSNTDIQTFIFVAGTKAGKPVRVYIWACPATYNDFGCMFLLGVQSNPTDAATENEKAGNTMMTTFLQNSAVKVTNKLYKNDVSGYRCIYDPTLAAGGIDETSYKTDHSTGTIFYPDASQKVNLLVIEPLPTFSTVADAIKNVENEVANSGASWTASGNDYTVTYGTNSFTCRDYSATVNGVVVRYTFCIGVLDGATIYNVSFVTDTSHKDSILTQTNTVLASLQMLAG